MNKIIVEGEEKKVKFDDLDVGELRDGHDIYFANSRVVMPVDLKIKVKQKNS